MQTIVRTTKIGASVFITRNGQEETLCHLPQGDTAQRLADAKRLVRAWNCHDELLAACKWFVQMFEGESGTGIAYWEEKHDFNLAKDAIAKATEEV